LGGVVLSLPDVQVQSAVVALDGGNIRAYSTNGTPMWNYSAMGRISPYVTRSREGTSYFSRTNGILIAVNRVGRELWRHNLESPLSAKVVVGWDSRLFVPTEKKISCYTASGNLLWTRTFESPFSIAPKLDRSGGIILALENNEVFRIDAFGNANRWTLSNNPVVLLSFDRQQILVLYTDGTMEILGALEDWFISAESETNSLPFPRLPSGPLDAVSSGGNFAATLNDGRVVLVSFNERKILWSGDSHIREIINNGTRPEPEVEMLYDERGIYILSKNGATGFSHEGRRLWYMFLQNVAAVPAFGNDGVLYAGGRDWILYAYKIEDRILPERISLYGPAADGIYGTGSPQASLQAVFPLNEYELRIKFEQAASAINSGRVGANELELTSLLMMVSTSHFGIQYRLNALQLLGKIGSHETIPWLTNFFYREIDPTLKSAAAAAIGAIGVDPQGIAIRTFFDSITHAGGIRDEQVLTAIASATGALCRFSGPPLSETGVRILTLLSTDRQPQIVSNRAKRELESLR
jgi:outer membrane protein assembly factor BamB